MSLTDNANNLVMPVSPMYGGNMGGGFFGGDGSWLILFLIFAMFGGNGWGGGFGGANALGYDFPWLLNGQNAINNNTNDGFRDQMIQNGVTSIRDGIGNLSTQLCNSTGQIENSLCSGFAGVEQGANARQIANMQTAFANQAAMSQGFADVASQLANCCCENRLAVANTQALIQSENCADRAALSDGLRDIIVNQNNNTQRILDQMCNDKIDSKNEKIADLQNQLNMATLRESQTAQNAFIAQGLTDEVDQLYNRLSNCPVPSTPVYGRTPIFSCNNGCGCGNGF